MEEMYTFLGRKQAFFFFSKTQFYEGPVQLTPVV